MPNRVLIYFCIFIHRYPPLYTVAVGSNVEVMLDDAYAIILEDWHFWKAKTEFLLLIKMDHFKFFVSYILKLSYHQCPIFHVRVIYCLHIGGVIKWQILWTIAFKSLSSIFHKLFFRRHAEISLAQSSKNRNNIFIPQLASNKVFHSTGSHCQKWWKVQTSLLSAVSKARLIPTASY